MKIPAKAIVCARADDELMVSGTVYDRFCSQCRVRVMIAPSGVRRLAREPDIEILCIPCAKSHVLAIEAAHESIQLETASSPEELVDELLSTRPNTWRSRH